MENFNKYILEAIDTVVDKKISEAPFDKTEIATIVEPLGDGKYLVSSNGEQYKVDSSYTALDKLDRVYVKTRENNKNKRYICGLVNDKRYLQKKEEGTIDGGDGTVFELLDAQVEDLKKYFIFKDGIVYYYAKSAIYEVPTNKGFTINTDIHNDDYNSEYVFYKWSPGETSDDIVKNITSTLNSDKYSIYAVYRKKYGNKKYTYLLRTDDSVQLGVKTSKTKSTRYTTDYTCLWNRENGYDSLLFPERKNSLTINDYKLYDGTDYYEYDQLEIERMSFSIDGVKYPAYNNYYGTTLLGWELISIYNDNKTWNATNGIVIIPHSDYQYVNSNTVHAKYKKRMTLHLNKYAYSYGSSTNYQFYTTINADFEFDTGKDYKTITTIMGLFNADNKNDLQIPLYVTQSNKVVLPNKVDGKTVKYWLSYIYNPTYNISSKDNFYVNQSGTIAYEVDDVQIPDYIIPLSYSHDIAVPTDLALYPVF